MIYGAKTGVEYMDYQAQISCCVWNKEWLSQRMNQNSTL